MANTLKFLTIDDQALIIESSRRVVFAQGAEVIRQGDDSGRALYIICSGVARVEVAGIAIAYLGPGSIIGEMAFLERAPASASIVAQTSLGVDVMDSERLHTLLASVPGFATRFYASIAVLLSERLRNASKLAANAQPDSRPGRAGARRFESVCAADCPEPVRADVSRWCAEMAELSLRAGDGAGDELFDRVIAACDRLQELLNRALAAHPETAGAMGGHIFRQAVPYMMASRSNAHAYSKPHVYTGDGEFVELIRAGRAAGDGAFGAAVDQWILQRPFARALRSRASPPASSTALTTPPPRCTC